jgi:hypothetical protein
MFVTESVKTSSMQSAALLAASCVETIPDAVANNMQVETVMPKEDGLPSDRHDVNSTMKGGGGEGYPCEQPAGVQHPHGLTLAQYAATKKLDEEFLESLGLTTIDLDGRKAVKIPYYGTIGSTAAVQFRTSMEEMASWRKGSKPCPYGLWKLSDAKAAGCICLVKGHGDPQTLWKHGFPALGLPIAPPWKEEDLSGYLKGIEKVYIVIDPEEGDEAVKQWLRNSEIRHSARLVTLDGTKDPSELYLRDPAGFKHKWAAALESAPTWQDIERSENSVRGKEVWLRCEEIAKQPNILDRFEEALGRSSVIGEGRAAKLLYLALTSRFLDRPVSIAVKGVSSCGKSFLNEQVLRFFPPSAYYVLTAMSDKALAYSEEPVKHRFLVIFEAPGMQGECASYLMRSLLSEGRICYDTVEATQDGIKPKRIEREGPTGLITTTTAISLHPENETRYFSVEVDDTPKQTTRVLLATAENINRTTGAIARKKLANFSPSKSGLREPITKL